MAESKQEQCHHVLAKRGFITPKKNSELPYDLRTSRHQLAFATLPSGRYMAKKTLETYNALIEENDPSCSEEEKVSFVNIKHTQYSEGELIPRLEDSIDGQDVFLFCSPFEPSFVADSQREIFESLSSSGLLREGISIDDIVDHPETGANKVIGNILRSKLLNGNLQELYNYISTLAENNAGHIVVVMPYFAYGRQNHPTRFERESTLAKLTADMLVEAGADGIVSYDSHSDDTRGFFPRKHFVYKMINPNESLLEIFRQHSDEETAFAFLDKGCVDRYHDLVKELGISGLYLSKVRRGEAEVVNVAGFNSNTKRVLFADDIGGTIGTIKKGLIKLNEMGVHQMVGAISHALLTKDAVPTLLRLHESYGLETLYIADTIPQPPLVRDHLPFVKERTVSRVLAKIINAIHYETSASQHTYRPNNGKN